jgi:alkaline phosphatase D
MFDLTTIRTAVRSEGGVSRRLFLAYGSALAALPSLAVRTHAADRKVTFASDPFTLGVASGDPDSTSVVLWTKLAPKPLDPDGGMKPEAIPVTWELAEDDAMKTVVAKGSAVATPQLGHSVHAIPTGLKPDRWYWYRFRAGDATSPVGRTRTTPAADATPDRLRFAFASCQHYEQGLFTAYAQMAKDELDLVFHLGDYIYEYPGTEKKVRKHTGPSEGKIVTLEDYRNRHNQYRSDPLLHGMHAKCPWLVTWDDHEFDNNYANDIQEEKWGKRTKPTDPATFLEQRANAYQAYYEMMPLRPSSVPHGPDLKLYRTCAYGRLASFQVLDTRQYRTDQPNGDKASELNDAALSPKNTLLGEAQRVDHDERLSLEAEPLPARDDAPRRGARAEARGYETHDDRQASVGVVEREHVLPASDGEPRERGDLLVLRSLGDDAGRADRGEQRLSERTRGVALVAYDAGHAIAEGTRATELGEERRFAHSGRTDERDDARGGEPSLDDLELCFSADE